METMKKFIDCYVPITTCNLRCSYCYITQQRLFSKGIEELPHTPQEIRSALSKKRLGGTCLFNFCAGGETLLSEQTIQIIKELLMEGHYIMVVTNGILTKRLEDIAIFPKELLQRLFFKFSFHYLELVRLNKLNQYFNNVKLMQQAGCSFTVEMTPHDELIPYIEQIKEVCMNNLGALCHVTIARSDIEKGTPILSKYGMEEYKKIWGTFNSNFFEFKSSIFGQKRNEFCYAGDWGYYLNLGTGNLTQCYGGEVLQNIFEDIETPFKKKPIGECCSQAHCYNGHAFLTLGLIPELNTPTYAELRNRKCSDGTEWLSSDMKRFFECRLVDENIEYSNSVKKQITIKNKVSRTPTKVKSIIKHIIKR